jgi:hypothetical protein
MLVTLVDEVTQIFWYRLHRHLEKAVRPFVLFYRKGVYDYYLISVIALSARFFSALQLENNNHSNFIHVGMIENLPLILPQTIQALPKNHEKTTTTMLLTRKTILSSHMSSWHETLSVALIYFAQHLKPLD